MKKIAWLGFALSLSVLVALPADGDVFVGKPGGKVRLHCGLPAGNSLTWQHQGSIVVRVRMGMIHKGTLDVSPRATARQLDLEIHSVKETDAGRFTCQVDRASKEHMLILIAVSASPSTVLLLGSRAQLQCQVKVPNEEPAVQWMKPDGSRHSGSKVAELESVAHSDAGTWNCTFSYDGKPYSQSLQISVKEPAPAPVTPRAGGVEPTCKDCGTSSMPPLSLPLGLSWWMWVVIGVGCLIVVVLMVFVIHLYKRIQKKKKMEENGEQPPAADV